MVATQFTFWVGYVAMGSALGVSHKPARSVVAAESPPAIRATSLTSPHAAAVAHQNAQVAVAHRNNAVKHAKETRRV